MTGCKGRSVILANIRMPGMRIYLRPEKGDADGGIKPGTAFEDLPDDWVCPVCGAGKDQFQQVLG